MKTLTILSMSIILMGSFGLYGQSETMNTENTHY